MRNGANSAFQTLEGSETLQGFVMTTLNKLPHVKPDLVRVDENWEEDLNGTLQKWLRSNHTENCKCEKHPFAQRPGDNQSPYYLLCRKRDHWIGKCTIVRGLVNRKKFFMDHNLCFNCGCSIQATDQSSAVDVLVQSANTGIIQAYVTNRRERTSVRTGFH